MERNYPFFYEIHKKFQQKNGFSLIEVIISLMLAGFFIGGLLFAGYFADNQRENLEEYWQSKDELELAYETTHRLIRQHAVSDITIIDNGIHFNDENGNVWSFVKNGSLYQKIINDDTENLLTSCTLLQFVQTGRMLTIELQTIAPKNFEGDPSDLKIAGKVFLRNNK